MKCCPVIHGYLCAIPRAVDLTVTINEVYKGEYDKLWETAEKYFSLWGSTRTLQHHRAFLCLETMYRWLLPVTAFPSKLATPHKRFDMSHEGMTELIEQLNHLRLDVTASLAERAFTRTKTTGMDPLLAVREKRVDLLARYAISSAVLLRRSLSNPKTSLRRIGTRLAQSFKAIDSHPARYVQWATHLITLTEAFPATLEDLVSL